MCRLRAVALAVALVLAGCASGRGCQSFPPTPGAGSGGLPPPSTDYTLLALNLIGGASMLGLFICVVLGVWGVWKAPKLAGGLLVTALSAWLLRLLMAKYAALLITLGLIALLIFAALFVWGHRKWIERTTGVDLDRDGTVGEKRRKRRKRGFVSLELLAAIVLALPVTIVHVSPAGNDAWPGTELQPVRTFGEAYDRLPDFGGILLVERGGVYFDHWPAWDKPRSTIGAYGQGPPPLIIPPPGQNGWASALGPGPLSGIIISGLHFQSPGWVRPLPGERAAAGIFTLRGGAFTIADCIFDDFPNSVVLQGYPAGNPLTHVIIRDSILRDPFRDDVGFTNLYIENAIDITLERDAFIAREGDDREMISHNVYIHESCGRATIRQVLAAGARTNLSVRGGGSVEDSLIVRGGQGIAFGYNVLPRVVPALARGNVIIESRDGWDGQPLGIGLWFDYTIQPWIVGNVICHSTDGHAPEPFRVSPTCGWAFGWGNVVYDWPPAPNTGGLYPDPGRTLSRFCVEVLGQPTDSPAHLIAETRTWDAARRWVMEGFGR